MPVIKVHPLNQEAVSKQPGGVQSAFSKGPLQHCMMQQLYPSATVQSPDDFFIFVTELTLYLKMKQSHVYNVKHLKLNNY